MSNELILKNSTSVVTRENRPKSKLGEKLASQGMTTRRIQANTNGTFKRIVNGEQIGKAVRGEMNVVIVDALEKVSRTYYSKAYDPDGEPTLPDCFSNLGDVPDPKASNAQHANCNDCPNNVAGSGGGNRRACRFNRRVALILDGDTSGDVYQFNIPAASLFGKGSGNTHPFEAYVKYLQANGEALDTVVTNISFDLESEVMTFVFSPARLLSDEELEFVQEIQEKPECAAYTKLTVAATDKVTKKPEAAAPQPKPKIVRSEEPDEEEEEAPKPIAKKVVPAKKAVLVEEADEDEAPQPTLRPSKKPEPAPAKGKSSLASVLQEWADD